MSQSTPMMKQYNRVKSEHADAILMFRMGDFYEMFNEDARVASRVLGLALTTRDKNGKSPVPLAGIPHHALETYLARLVGAGYKVAICDQVEDPKKAKGLVRREVTEVVTPGTVVSSAMLDEKRSNFLVCLLPGKAQAGIAQIDLSTGEFLVSEPPLAEMRQEILRADAAELVVPEGQMAVKPLESLLEDVSEIPVTPIQDWEFGLEQAKETLCSHFGVANLDGFGCSDLDEGLRAAGAAVRYLKELKKRDLTQITSIRRLRRSDHLILDETTQRNLELVAPIETGHTEATLLSILDRAVTGMGARLLRQWIQFPLIDTAAIGRRLDAVADLFESATEHGQLKMSLRNLCDLPRVAGRIASGRTSAREVVSLRHSLELLPEILSSLTPFSSTAIRELASAIPDLADVADLIRNALVDAPPPTHRDGGIIREGYDAELDSLRSIAARGKDWLGRLQTEERDATGIPSLKVGYNKVFGYYIEVTNPHLDLVPDRYLRKQTLVNAERFITPELKEREATILTAEEDALSLERDVFERTTEEVARSAARLQQAASALAAIDVLSSLATAARDGRYVRPDLNESTCLTILEGRHPVVERLLESESFVPNDAHMDVERQQIILLTGPNMAGKSTYLRQVGLIVIMAQMGSFVPARRATVGVVDRVFTRIGGMDSLARGRSTFLVEMSETANILNNATTRSLVLLDEIGRGTSTFDGLSLAWAVTEYLHNRDGSNARTLFATHYHELTELEDVLPRVMNMNVLVRKTGDKIAFLRKIVPGAADRSYGVEVAKLAGIPEEVISRAKEVLANLEEAQYVSGRVPRLAGGPHGPLASAPKQIPLFGASPSEIEQEIAEMDLTTMTPLTAFERLAAIKKRVERGK